MSASQSAINRWLFRTALGGIDPVVILISVFVPWLLESYMYGRVFNPVMGPCPLRVWRDVDVVPRGKSRSALAL